MNRFCISLCLILLAAAGLAGCGQGQKGEARVWVTRDRGATLLDEGRVPAGLTALQGLDRLTPVETGYGGAFVSKIDGVASSRLHQRDWFFYVNGYEADRGAASYRLRAGDVEWWDYRSWHGSERAQVRRSHRTLYCYAVSAQDDKGVGTPALGAVLRAGSGPAVRTKEGRGCLKVHTGSLVRATLSGAVRSNALP